MKSTIWEIQIQAKIHLNVCQDLSNTAGEASWIGCIRWEVTALFGIVVNKLNCAYFWTCLGIQRQGAISYLMQKKFKLIKKNYFIRIPTLSYAVNILLAKLCICECALGCACEVVYGSKFNNYRFKKSIKLLYLSRN